VVWLFVLPTIPDRLLEDAIVIAEPITHGRELHSRHRVDEAERLGMAVARVPAYLTDLLTRLVDGWPQSHIDELMPWHWAPEKHG
jgi:hypothetical protein